MSEGVTPITSDDLRALAKRLTGAALSGQQVYPAVMVVRQALEAAADALSAAGRQQETGELREQLAALCHEQWSGWMRHLWSKCDQGTYIPEVWRLRWERQMRTPYAELREDEKESDRKEADRILTVLAPVRAQETLRERLKAHLSEADDPCMGGEWPCEIAKALDALRDQPSPRAQETVTRLEVIDETGRAYSRWGIGLTLVYQDDGRTLKVFLMPRDQPAPPATCPHGGTMGACSWCDLRDDGGLPEAQVPR